MLSEEATTVIDPMSLFRNDVTGLTDGLTLLSVQDAVNGTVSIDSNGKIEFTGKPLYHGDAYFSYTVEDAYGRQSAARVQVLLASTNHPPVAIDHSGLTGFENTVLKIPFSVLLQGATDPENDTLTVIGGAALLDDKGNPIAPYSEQNHFTGTNVAGIFKNNAVLGDYVELDIAPDYYGFAGFQYKVSDGNGGFTWANEEIYIDHINQAPRAGDKNVEKITIRLGKANVLNLSDLLASAYDPEGDAFRFVGIHDAVSGMASYDATLGTVSFTAKALGEASFQFDLADIYNAQSTITVDLTVIPEFDPPIARDDGGFVLLENQALVIDPALLLANDSDPNGDTIVLQIVGRFAKDGYVSINSDGMIVFVPRTNYNGAASFTYQITDSHGGVAHATVSININPVDQGAILHDDVVKDVQDKPLTILPAEAFGNDVDPLGNVLFFGSVVALGQLDTKYLSKNVQFSALTVRGKALSDWLSFDASTMTFTGVMPAQGTAPIDVEVKTFDPDNGNSFVHYFTFKPSDATALAGGLSVNAQVMAGYTIRGEFSQSFDYGWTGVGQTVSVSVTMADGTALPAWLAFDPATLTLFGGAPAGTVPFAVLAAYSYLDPTSGATLLLRRNDVIDPSTVGAGIELNAHIATLALGAGTWNAHLAGNQPLPEWLDFDPTTHTLAFSGYAPEAGTAPARIDIDFTPTSVALPDGTFASSHGGFTLEFVVDPNATLDPAISAILANSAYFAQQNTFGIDLARTGSVSALLADGNPLPDWLRFDPRTLQFSGSPPPEYVGSIPVRLNVVGNGLNTPDFSILTDVVVDSTFNTIKQNSPAATVAPELVTLNPPVIHDNGSIAVQYTTVDEKGTKSVNAAIDVVDIAPRLVPIRATNDSFVLVQGHGVSFTLDDLLANDRDDNGDPFRIVSVTQPAHGTLVETGAHHNLVPPANLLATATSSFSATLVDGTALPGWMTLDTSTGAISANPPIDVLGSYSVQYTLTDGASTQIAQATYAIDGNQGVSFTYTPDPLYFGDDGITYTVTDDKQAPVTANVALHVAPALVASNDKFSMTSDSSITIGVASLLANDVSADGRLLTVTTVTTPSAGSLTFDGSYIVYASTHYYDGAAIFQYTVADDEGHSQTASVTLGIASIDHAPIANPIVLAGQENLPVTVSLADILSHAVDPDGEPVQLVSITPGAGTQARALVLPDGSTQFVPNAYKYGDMAFSYVVTDGYKSSTGSIDVDFAKVPQPPVANTDGVYQDNENTPIRLSLASLLANDVDPDGTALAISAVYRGVNGSVAIDGTDAVFTPRTGYFGTASFNYTLTNAEGQQSEGLVKFLVLPNANPPIAVSDSGFSMVQDTTLDIDPARLLANDIDPDGIGLTFLGFTSGPVVKLDDGLYRVTPAFNYSGPLVLTYAITNDSNVIVTTTATIDVQHVEHAPNAVDDHFAMTEDQPLVLRESQLLANDYDLDNNAFGLTSIVDASHVSVALDPVTGLITATPDQHFHGPAWFDYQITDSTGRTGMARVDLDVAFVNYPPAIADIGPLSATEEQNFSIALPANVVSDIENDPLLITLQTPGGGALPGWQHFDRDTLTLSGTPPAGVFGNVALELRADDGQGVATKDFSLVIAHVNHAPSVLASASIETGAIVEMAGMTGSPVQDSVAGVIAFADVDSADTHGASVSGVAVSGAGGGLAGNSALLTFLTLGSVTEPAGGQPGLQAWSFSAADRTFDYLAAGETVTLTYAVQIVDNAGGATTTNVSVTVTGTNDAPVAANVAAATRQNDVVTQTFAGTDADEGDVLTYRLLSAPTLGTAISNPDGTFTFDPGHALDGLAAGETQVVTFTYQAADKAGITSNAATVSVVVGGVNDAPVTVLPAAQIVPTGRATDIRGITTADVDHGATSTVVLSAGYGTLSATSIAGGTISGGNTRVLTLSGTPDVVTGMLASLTYTSAGNASDSITVVTSDGMATIANGGIPVTVDGGPTTTAGQLTIGHGQTQTVTSLINGRILPGLAGDTETVTTVTASKGQATLINGVISYAAPASGADTITYTVKDQLGDTATGIVAVTIDAGPTAGTGTLTIGHGQTQTVTGLINGLILPGLATDIETITTVTASKGQATLINGVISYAAPASGADTITYTVKDQLGDTATGIVAVTIDAGPTAGTGTLTIGHGQTQTVTSLINGLILPGLAGDTETVTTVTASNGQATLANGVISYTAPASGADTITYSVKDQLGDTATGTVAVTIDAGPTAGTGTLTIGHGQTQTVTSLINGLIIKGLATDIETITTVIASKGQATLTNGVINYTAPASGADTITYTVNDQLGDTATGTVAVAINAGPTAGTGTLTIGHGQTQTVTGLINGLILPGLAGDTEIVTTVIASNGQTTLANGVISYTAPASGADTISYTVKDQLGGTATGTVAVTIDAGPTAGTGSLAIGHGQTQTVTNLINGLIIKGLATDIETITTVTASKGQATLINGVISYAAPASGADTITYTVKDQLGDTATGILAVTIDAGPTAGTGTLTIGHGQTQTVTSVINGLIIKGLATDIETITTVTASKGQATLANGVISYTAPASGADTITYAVKDQLGDTATGTVAVTIDTGPTAGTGSLTIGHSQTQTVTNLINGLIIKGLATDIETITTVTASKGQATLTTGVIAYTAPATGTDTITYTVKDQLGDTATGTVAVTTDPGPSAGTLTTTVKVGTSVNLTSAILGVVTAGLKGDVLTLTGDSITGTLGTVSLTGGRLTYTASGNLTLQHIPANGTLADSFTYTVADQFGDTATANVKITVNNPATVIAGPQFGSGTIQVPAGGSYIVNASGYNNIIIDAGGNDIVNAGLGNASVYVNTGDVVVNLGGYNNLVTGFNKTGSAAVTGSNGNVTVSGSLGNTTVNLGDGQDTLFLGGYNNIVMLGNGNDIVNAGLGNAVVTLGNGNDQVTLSGFTNSVVAGNGNNQISGAQGSTIVTLGNGNNNVSLSGFTNVVQAGNGNNTITAGAGAQVTVGGGTNTITVTGFTNKLTLGAGTDTVNAGSGDIITVNASTLMLKGGTQEMVFLGAGTASIDDLSISTTVLASKASGTATILDVMKDSGFVLDLTGGVGGFTSAASVVAALRTDGHGGTQLALGTGTNAAVIDFANTSASFLTSAHFKIG